VLEGSAWKAVTGAGLKQGSGEAWAASKAAGFRRERGSRGKLAEALPTSYFGCLWLAEEMPNSMTAQAAAKRFRPQR